MRFDVLKRSLSTLLALPLLAQPVATGRPQPAPAPMPAPVPAPAPIALDAVIARIGTRVIVEKDFQTWLKIMAGPRQAEQLLKNTASLANLRQRYLDAEVLAAQARKDGLQKTAEFREMLKAQEDQVLVRLLMSEDQEGSAGAKLKAKVENPSDEEIRAFFDKNAQRYETPEKFTARHIRINVKKVADAKEQQAAEDEAKAKLAKIQDELKAGKTFEVVAKEYTEDLSSKQTGGLIKESPYNRNNKALEDAVRKQEIGKVGEPVKTDLGYELIVVEARFDKQPGVFETAKDKVKQQMLPERREAAVKAYMEEAKKNVDFVAGADAAKSAPKAAAKKAAKKK